MAMRAAASPFKPVKLAVAGEENELGILGIFTRGYSTRGVAESATKQWMAEPVHDGTDFSESAVRGFSTRFGLTAAQQRGADMIATITNPKDQVEKLNSAYTNIAQTLVTQYSSLYSDYIAAGLTQDEAAARADKRLTPLVQGYVKDLKLAFPYALGGGGAGKKIKKGKKSSSIKKNLKTMAKYGAPGSEEQGKFNLAEDLSRKLSANARV